MVKHSKKKPKFVGIQHAKMKFYTGKQKQILTSLARIKKINFFLYSKLFEITQQKKSKILQKVIQNLQEKINQNQIYTRKINKIYKFLLLSNKKAVKKNTHTLALEKIKNYKFKLLWKKLRNQTNSFRRTRFLKQNLPNLLLKIQEKIFKKIHIHQWSFLKNNFLFQKLLNLNFFFGQIANKNLIWQNYFLILNWNTKLGKNNKTKLLSKSFVSKDLLLKSIFRLKLARSVKKNITKKSGWRTNFQKTVLWQELRWKKKRKNQTRGLQKNMKLRKKDFKNYSLFIKKNKFVKNKNQIRVGKALKKINKFLKKNKIARYYQYRLPYRKSYFNFLRLTTNFHLKYLIQDLIKKYFFLQVEAKILHAFNDYKNQNYFRLVFPIYKKKKNQLVKKYRRKSWTQKQIFLSTQLKFSTAVKKQKKQNWINKQMPEKIELKNLRKKKLNLLTKKKKQQRQIQNKFARIKRNKDFRQSFKYFIPTVMQFSRTLNPEILANVLTKVIKKSKKQTWLLNNIKYLLTALNLPKNVGYKIALAGRINSKKKSQLIYFTRKNNPLQVFKKKMNFAYAQSNARIGTFGIKIWVYF